MNRPVLQSVLLSPNPVSAKSSITVTITAIDEEIIFAADSYYAAAKAEIYANEEVGII